MQHTEAESELRALMLRGLDGDQVAYRDLLEKLSRRLRAFFLRRLQGWPDDVEDLVQECLLAMHNQRHTYQSNQPLTAWVYAIARYKMIDLLRESGKKILAQAEQEAASAGVQCKTMLVETLGLPVAEVILGQVKATSADLIVLGTHGRRGLKRIVMGSVAEGVLRESTVPVLLVRAPEAD